MTPWEIQKAWVALLKKWVAYLKKWTGNKNMRNSKIMSSLHEKKTTHEQQMTTWETQKAWVALLSKKNRAWVALFKKVSRKQKHEKLKSHE